MKSLNRMMVEFARGKDKQPRKKRSLAKSMLIGGAAGAAAPVILGTLAGAALGGYSLARMGKYGRQALADGSLGKNAAAKMVGGLALTGTTAGTLGIVPGAALGAAGGAAAYGIGRMRDKNRESKSPIQSVRRRFGI